MAQDHQKNRLEGVRCDKIMREASDARTCNRLLFTKDGLMCDRCKGIHSLTDLLRKAIEAGLNPKEVLEIPALKQEFEKQVTEMIEKNKKSKKTKKKTKGWSLYYCSLCQKYQQVRGQCRNCGQEETKRIAVKTGAEYCELLGKHKEEKAGETYCGPGSYYRIVYKCIRCGKKSTLRDYQNKEDGSHEAWGEQP